LTSQLLAFSRRQVVQVKTVDLANLVSGMQDMLQRLIGETILLKTISSATPAFVKIDPAQFEQVVVNLAVNARDAMPDGGQLTFEVAPTGIDYEPGVMFCVRDTGIGMDAEVQSHLFEPFYTTKERGKGTGLGLSIVYGIVKQSGGSIRVQSEPGQGAAFHIVLPRVLVKEAEEQSTKPAEMAAPGIETILLVEDEAAVRKMVGEVLRLNGYTVLEASSGEEAVEIFRQSRLPIPVLVTDMIMPGMNGRVLAERLRLSRPDLKVIYLSGYTENILDLHGPLPPGTAFLQKPFTPAVLIRNVRELLDRPFGRLQSSSGT
jgi:CheY-like chemotaxis protein